MLSVSIGHRRWQGQLVKKDSLRNIEETGEFVVNVVTEALLEKMNQTAAEYPPEVSEFSAVGLTPLPSLRVKAPRVLESPVQLECKLHKVLMLGEPPVNGLVIGEVVYIHVDDAVCSAAGDIDPQLLRPVSRLGGTLYATLGEILSLPRPELK
jgi:flavin reductase (DIM6/NTAB) family NADH-FMN oxidoreductase RutF